MRFSYQNSIMESEMKNMIKVGLIASASLVYCYILSSRIPKGMMRLLSVVPIICIFTLLPLLLSSVIPQLVVGIVIAWLANFKLLFFALDHNSDPASAFFLTFLVTTSLPVKMKQIHHKNGKTKNNLDSPPTFVVDLVLWCSTFELYVKKPYKILAGPIGIQCLFTLRLILCLQLVYTAIGVVAQKILEHELEPQFNRPHLSSSLQNFWEKRWNRVNSSALRSVIYTPTRSIFTPIIGTRWARNLAILATFTVSGLMHELVYTYAVMEWPTWEATWYFIINGVCVAIEIEVKKKASESGWVLHPLISRLLTIAFISVTGTWLCCSELGRSGVANREIEEFAVLINYIK